MEDVESKDDEDDSVDKDTRNTESKKRNHGQAKFKCEQCNYEPKRKHMNTKHGKLR